MPEGGFLPEGGFRPTEGFCVKKLVDDDRIRTHKFIFGTPSNIDRPNGKMFIKLNGISRRLKRLIDGQ